MRRTEARQGPPPPDGVPGNGEAEQPMSVSIDWFTLKEPVANMARNMWFNLSDEQFDQFKELHPSGKTLDELYNVGHPHRWPADFPRQITLSVAPQPLSAQVSISLSLQSLFQQIAAHLESWEPKDPNNYTPIYEKVAENLATGYRALAQVIEDRTVVLAIEKGYDETSPYEVNRIY